MSINVTLFWQMVTLAIFIWATMKFAWPHILDAMEERQKKIADGLAAGEKGERELELASVKKEEIVRDARIKASSIVDEANKRSEQLIEDARQKAREEGERLLELAKKDIEQEYQQTKQSLLKEVGRFALNGAEKLLQQNINEAANHQLIDNMLNELETK